jgi:hypothetical protein
MNTSDERIFDHVLELRPGDAEEIDLRFAMDEGASVTVTLAAVDLSACTAELAIDDLWGGYRMVQFAEDAGRWLPVWPDDDGDVHAVVRFGAGSLLSVSSDIPFFHSIELTEVAWMGGALRLTFVETG